MDILARKQQGEPNKDSQVVIWNTVNQPYHGIHPPKTGVLWDPSRALGSHMSYGTTRGNETELPGVRRQTQSKKRRKRNPMFPRIVIIFKFKNQN